MTDAANMARTVSVQGEETNLTAFWSMIEKIRQVHALEHGTLTILGEANPKMRLGGFSTDRGFFVYGAVESGELLRAAHSALVRLNNGEPELAIHPQCGTNLSVGLLAVAGLGLGVSAILPRRLVPQLLGAGFSALGAVQIAKQLGTLAQRHLTTSLPRNLEVIGVRSLADGAGRNNHFVQTQFIG
jgi:Domain of unknown function (DUF6391)